MLSIASTCTSISCVTPCTTPHTTFAPGKPFWGANKTRRCPNGFPVHFWIIFITTSVCISSCWPSSRPSLVSFWFDFCTLLIGRWWIFASITICILIVIRLLKFSSSIISPPPWVGMITTLTSPCKCSCCGFSCCPFPSQSFSLSTNSLGNGSLDLFK